jgi:hypothetical protein
MVCTGWRQAVHGLPSRSSIYADEGVKAHELLEMALRLDLPPEELTSNPEMAEAVGHAVDWLNQYQVHNPKAKWWIEHSLPWGEAIGYPHLKGRSDLVVVTDTELTVVDYKHGIGVMVDPAESKQLRIYLIGLIKKYGRRGNYQLIVIQPRARHVDGPVRIHRMSHEEIKAFAREVQVAARANLEGTGERTAGEHCRFCAAAPTCKTLAEFSLSLAVCEFEGLGPG